jgi:hypothetical protein
MRIKIDGTSFQVGEEWREPLTTLVERLNALCVEDIYGGVQCAPLLHDNGVKRIAIIKEVRSATGMNLKDAKKLSDQAPVRLPVMTAERARAFVNAVNAQGGRASMPEPPLIDRLAAIAETAEKEEPEAVELFQQFLATQERLTKILKVGELNGQFRDKIESYLSP